MTVKDRLILVKLGGSVITDKSRRDSFARQAVQRLVAEINQVYSQSNADWIIGTGAGSFGHFTAHEYGLRGGAQTDRQRYGACLTHRGVQVLCGLVADELLAVDLPAFVVSPSAILHSDNGQIVSSWPESLVALLNAGTIPMVHGDMLPDASQRLSGVSTESVFQVCINELRLQYQHVTVVYVQSVDGVIDENGERIADLYSDDPIVVHNHHDHDVTGGIAGKVVAARQAAMVADEVYIIGSQSGAIVDVIIARGRTGTKVHAVAS